MARTTVVARIREFAVTQLRNEYPYMMKTAVLEDLADRVARDCHEGIEDQYECPRPQVWALLISIGRSQEMQATKARRNFFSLPIELRNEVYELAVTPSVRSRHMSFTFVGDAGYCDVILPSLLHTSRQVR